MDKISSFVLLTAAIVLGCVATATQAQQGKSIEGNTGAYPSKPVRIIVGAFPGGGSDLVFRIVATKLSELWGQAVIIDNRPGAVGGVGLELAARANPDGYTLVPGTTQNVTGMVLKVISVDMQKAFEPIRNVTSQSYLLVATPSLPANSVKELIAYAKARPLIYGSSGIGGATHLGMELFRFSAGIPDNMTHVPYKGSGQSTLDMMAGRIHLMVANPITLIPFIKSGKLKGYAVTTLKRNPLLPDLPAVAETIPDFELTSWYGLLAPAGTPPAIVVAINREFSRALQSPDVAEKLSGDGADVVPAHTPAQFKNHLAREIAKWEKFIKSSGIKVEL